MRKALKKPSSLPEMDRACNGQRQAKRKAAGTGAKSGGKPKERQKTISSHQRSQQARRGPCDPDLAPGADIVVGEMAIKWRKSKRWLRSRHDQPAAQRVAKPTAAIEFGKIAAENASKVSNVLKVVTEPYPLLHSHWLDAL
jgi:hypothetical protein